MFKKRKQHECPLISEWMNKGRHIHTMEYYVTTKRNEVLIHATTWMELENIYRQKPDPNNTYCRISFVWHIQDFPGYKTKSSLVTAKAGERKEC